MDLYYKRHKNFSVKNSYFLHHRNNSDDVAVLRSELHNVQKIMVEDIGEKKEQQLADLRNNNEKLKEELVQLKSESTSKLSSLTQKVQEVEEEKEDLKEKFYCADAQSESLKAHTVI